MPTHTIYDDGTYLANNPTWHEEHSAWKARQIVRMLTQNSIQPGSVREIGCGAGEILRELTRHLGGGVVFEGYDISPQALAMCKKKEAANLRFHLADLLTRDVPPCDLALAIDVFEHVEDYYGFLREFRVKGHYKIFHIPLDLSAQTVMRGAPLSTLRASMGHIHFFTKETALGALSHAGYEVIDWFYTKGSLELPHSWKADLLRIPRRMMFALNQNWTVRTLGGFSMLVLAR